MGLQVTKVPVNKLLYKVPGYMVDSFALFLTIFIICTHVPPLQNGYMYTRWGNPTVDAAANTLARLEGAAGSLLFSSGMAAIVTSMLTFLKSGDHVVSKSLGARQAIVWRLMDSQSTILCSITATFPSPISFPLYLLPTSLPPSSPSSSPFICSPSSTLSSCASTGNLPTMLWGCQSLHELPAEDRCGSDMGEGEQH